MEQEENDNYKCICQILKEPCDKRCTCVNAFSSFGCIFCASYGSLEQRKNHAKWIKSKLLDNKKSFTIEDIHEAFKAGNRRGYCQRSLMANVGATCEEPDEDTWINENL